MWDVGTAIRHLNWPPSVRKLLGLNQAVPSSNMRPICVRYQALRILNIDGNPSRSWRIEVVMILVLMDNVLEHLPDQPTAIQNICRSLKPKGVVFIIVPNKLWPIEAHYGLPFLSYLPLSLANFYLRLTRQGADYTDASYAPTYFGLNRLLGSCTELSFQYVLPADLLLTTLRGALHYRLGTTALRYCRWLWPISKVFLVIAVKSGAKD